MCTTYFSVNAGLGKLCGKGPTVDRMRREGVVCRVVCPRSCWASLEDHGPLKIWSLLPETLRELSIPTFYVHQENIVSNF